MSIIAVVGLGYVGLPLAIAFSQKHEVIGFDIDNKKITKYKSGCDVTGEIACDEWKRNRIFFTCDQEYLHKANTYIICVPTPVYDDGSPDLSAIVQATKMVAEVVKKEDLVIYESTVYPGATDEICVPLLEECSSLRCGTDFMVGYSPERINPGDKEHGLLSTVKIVAGYDEEALRQIKILYESILGENVYAVSSIKTAEMTKLAENTQRDVNIAFMNELAVFCEKLGINISEVQQAMNTKWNALRFKPGLVGGHCICVDPYYYISQSKKIGSACSMAENGRRVNEEMPHYIVGRIIDELAIREYKLNKTKVLFMGVTFKENCRDIRNSCSIKIVELLRKTGLDVKVTDHMADADELERLYNICPINLDDAHDIDCIIIAVPHDIYCKMEIHHLDSLFANKNKKMILDIFSARRKDEMENHGYVYWSL